MNGRFLLAKYVSDLERGEPRNIGVLVWTKGAVSYRFVDPHKVDYVADVENCEQWIEYWQDLASQKKIQVFSDRPVTNRSSRFLDAIQKTQKGNYLLGSGGHVFDEVTVDNIDDVAAFLFDRMVSTKKVHDVNDR